jgi:predicted DNA-binding transcriptional regulator AlpA
MTITKGLAGEEKARRAEERRARRAQRKLDELAALKDATSDRLFTFGTLPVKGINYSPAYIRKLWHAGKFPQPIYLSERRPAWTEQMLDDWLDQLERKLAE